jgi:hypothetical protein
MILRHRPRDPKARDSTVMLDGFVIGYLVGLPVVPARPLHEAKVMTFMAAAPTASIRQGGNYG